MSVTKEHKWIEEEEEEEKVEYYVGRDCETTRQLIQYILFSNCASPPSTTHKSI